MSKDSDTTLSPNLEVQGQEIHTTPRFVFMSVGMLELIVQFIGVHIFLPFFKNFVNTFLNKLNMLCENSKVRMGLADVLTV